MQPETEFRNVSLVVVFESECFKIPPVSVACRCLRCCMQPMQTPDTPLACKYLSKWNEQQLDIQTTRWNICYASAFATWIHLHPCKWRSLRRAHTILVYAWWRMHLSWKWIYWRCNESLNQTERHQRKCQHNAGAWTAFVELIPVNFPAACSSISTNSLKTIFLARQNDTERARAKTTTLWNLFDKGTNCNGTNKSKKGCTLMLWRALACILKMGRTKTAFSLNKQKDVSPR